MNGINQQHEAVCKSIEVLSSILARGSAADVSSYCVKDNAHAMSQDVPQPEEVSSFHTTTDLFLPSSSYGSILQGDHSSKAKHSLSHDPKRAASRYSGDSGYTTIYGNLENLGSCERVRRRRLEFSTPGMTSLKKIVIRGNVDSTLAMPKPYNNVLACCEVPHSFDNCYDGGSPVTFESRAW
jgi:hypothetical protein